MVLLPGPKPDVLLLFENCRVLGWLFLKWSNTCLDCKLLKMIYSLAIVANLGLYEQLLRPLSKLESSFLGPINPLF